jgi:hypothetical protein
MATSKKNSSKCDDIAPFFSEVVFVAVIMGLFFVARLQNFTHKSARSSSPSSQVAIC